MRHVALMLGVAAIVGGCASGSSDDSSEGAAAPEVISTSCSTPSAPSDVSDLKPLDACQLKALFNSDLAKKNTTDVKALAKGAYDGVPLCRKEILPTQLPPNLIAAQPIIELLRLSNRLDNAFASKIWHGKEFTLPDGADKGSVKNFIDVHSDGITAETRKAAEAVHFLDKQNNWMVLDYTGASTGLEGFLLGPISAKLIEHVYDTARLVNPEKNIYLGMAYLVNTPGKYEPGTPNTVESCYFALQKHKD